MGQSVRLRAFAKANLSLNITGKNKDNGLHELDSVMLSLDAFDTVTVTERSDDKINVRFVNADIGEDNTAAKAARAVQAVIGGGWDIAVEKGIPIGAGLGGSSADGAAVLRALDVMYKLPAGGLARVRGTGEDLFFIENKAELFIVGLMSGEVSTARAYAEFDRLHESGAFCPTDNDKLCELLLSGDPSAVELAGNALYAPACELAPQIQKNAELLKSHGAAVNLTGSGGMVLGYFTDIQKFAACARALGGMQGFYVFAPTRTGILHERL